MYAQFTINMPYVYRLSVTFVSAEVNATTTWSVSQMPFAIASSSVFKCNIHLWELSSLFMFRRCLIVKKFIS